MDPSTAASITAEKTTASSPLASDNGEATGGVSQKLALAQEPSTSSPRELDQSPSLYYSFQGSTSSLNSLFVPPVSSSSIVNNKSSDSVSAGNQFNNNNSMPQPPPRSDKFNPPALSTPRAAALELKQSQQPETKSSSSQAGSKPGSSLQVNSSAALPTNAAPSAAIPPPRSVNYRDSLGIELAQESVQMAALPPPISMKNGQAQLNKSQPSMDKPGQSPQAFQQQLLKEQQIQQQRQQLVKQQEMREQMLKQQYQDQMAKQQQQQLLQQQQQLQRVQQQKQTLMEDDVDSDVNSTVFNGSDTKKGPSFALSQVGSSASNDSITLKMDPLSQLGDRRPGPKPFPSSGLAMSNPQDLSRNETSKPQRTNIGNTQFIMALLSEMWLFNAFFILGGTFLMTFYAPQFYVDDQLWNTSCYWKLAWMFPLPYTIICFLGLVLPFRTPKFLYDNSMPKRRCDNLYILTVTKGDNRDAVYRSWNAHKHLERLHPSVRVHVLTDEPYYFENINCYTCPKNFRTANSLYKARALEWYRQTMRFTEYDWVLHLDEESVVDDESVKRILEFIWYETDYHWGQGVILYNQYRYWKNWFFTVADALRVGDDLSRFQLQYSYFHNPIFGAHGSFLLTNGLVENSVTWDLGSLTEDYQFAMHSWALGYRCGKVPALVREQSPIDFIGFLKQRRRWFIGIFRLRHILPRIWATFWAIGLLCLYGTIISVIMSFVIPMGTPRWFGFLKDFSFMTFVYLYFVGILIQDLDKGLNPLITLIHIPITIVFQFVAVVMEAMALMYGIFCPPKDFDVIKK